MVTARLPRPRRGSLAVLSVLGWVGIGLTACSDPTPTTPDQTQSNPTVVVGLPPTSVPVDQPVRVRASIGVPPSSAVSALVPFVHAHAASVNAGRVTAELASVTTPAELSRQRAVVAFAVAHGYAVPSDPMVRVVSVVDRSATVARFGVCFWLPSTEYVDADSGEPPNGPVPAVWAPAVATVRLVHLTWSVDTVSEPDNESTIECGSDP